MNFGNKKGIGIIASVIVVAAVAIVALSGSAFADLSLTATNVNMSSDDGQIKEVTVAPTGRVTWDGLDTTPNNLLLRVYVKKKGNSNWTKIGQAVINKSDFADKGTKGKCYYDFNPIEIDSAVSYEVLDADTDDSTNDTIVQVMVKGWLRDSNNNTIDPTPVNAWDGFHVNVTNEPAASDLGGDANTDGEPTVTE